LVKETYIRLRCTENFKKEVEELASKENRTVSNYIENILKKEINKMENLKNDLIEKIERAIEKQAMQSQKMGTEDITTKIELSEIEIETFKTTEEFDGNMYFWEIENNTLIITKSELFKRLAKMKEFDKEDGKVIYFDMNIATFEVTVSNNEKVDFGNSPNSEKEAIKIIKDQWGGWKTFEWIEE
jgi:predicted DNA-binding protein